jgi:hypothetical protein
MKTNFRKNDHCFSVNNIVYSILSLNMWMGVRVAEGARLEIV